VLGKHTRNRQKIKMFAM